MKLASYYRLHWLEYGWLFASPEGQAKIVQSARIMP
jgi:hypothetical protein